MAKTAGIGLRMWQSMQAWKSVRAAGAQKSLDEGASAASAITSAWSNQITGTATLISKITQKRVATEALAKLSASVNKTTTKTVNKTV
jgi:hypothetical protein